jgi:hypothetical protein
MLHCYAIKTRAFWQDSVLVTWRRVAVLESSHALGLVCEIHESERGGTEGVESAIKG